MHELELDLSQLSVKNEDLSLRVLEELGIDLAEAYENFQQEDVDWEEVRQEISELRGKIERLGNVNIDAIHEQEELEQRYEFLTDQAEDLNKSKSQLEQLINRINKPQFIDPRSVLEVVMDLRRQGIRAFPQVHPTSFWGGYMGNFNKELEVKIDGQEILPLSGIANVRTVYCNEGLGYAIYDSDEHGFHNPKGLMAEGEVDILGVGD